MRHFPASFELGLRRSRTALAAAPTQTSGAPEIACTVRLFEYKHPMNSLQLGCAIALGLSNARAALVARLLFPVVFLGSLLAQGSVQSPFVYGYTGAVEYNTTAVVGDWPNFYASWNAGGVCYYSRSTNGGADWSAPIALTTSGGGRTRMVVLDSNVLLAYVASQSIVRVHTSIDGGAVWVPPLPSSPPATPANETGTIVSTYSGQQFGVNCLEVAGNESSFYVALGTGGTAPPAVANRLVVAETPIPLGGGVPGWSATIIGTMSNASVKIAAGGPVNGARVAVLWNGTGATWFAAKASSSPTWLGPDGAPFVSGSPPLRSQLVS